MDCPAAGRRRYDHWPQRERARQESQNALLKVDQIGEINHHSWKTADAAERVVNYPDES